MPQLVDALECPRFFCSPDNKYKKFVDSAQALGQETCRRAADAIEEDRRGRPRGLQAGGSNRRRDSHERTNDAKKPPMVPSATNGGMVDKMWAVLDRHFNPRENKVQRAVANALGIALDEHEFIIGELTKSLQRTSPTRIHWISGRTTPNPIRSCSRTASWTSVFRTIARWRR